MAEIIWMKNEMGGIHSEDGRFDIERANGYYWLFDNAKEEPIKKTSAGKRMSQKTAKQLAAEIVRAEKLDSLIEARNVEGTALHHIDGDPHNNDLDNLTVISISDKRKEESRMTEEEPNYEGVWINTEDVPTIPMPSAESRTKKSKQVPIVEQPATQEPETIAFHIPAENRLDWLPPVQESHELSNWHVWNTLCGRYKIVLSVSVLNEGENYFAAVRGRKILRNNLRNLDAALRCVERDLQETLGVTDIESNDMTTLEAAEKLGLAKLPDVGTKSKNRADSVDTSAKSPHNTYSGPEIQTEGVAVMQIKETAARTLLTAVGFTAVEKCNVKRLVSKLTNLPLTQSELKEPEDSEQKAMLQNVLAALQEGNKIEVVPDEGDPQVTEKVLEKVVTTKKIVKGEKSKPKVVTTTVKTKVLDKKGKTKPDKENKSKSSKPIKEKKERQTLSTEKDKFGSRLGTAGAKANAVLTKKPKKMKQIMEEAQLGATMFDHLNKLVKAGLVAKSEEGFHLPK